VNKNQVSLTVKSASGGTWPDAVFNVHQKVQHVLDKALVEFHLDRSIPYEVLLAGQRSLQLDDSLEGAGVTDGAVLLVRSLGRPVDG
jgi:hypothetical protein